MSLSDGPPVYDTCTSTPPTSHRHAPAGHVRGGERGSGAGPDSGRVGGGALGRVHERGVGSPWPLRSGLLRGHTRGCSVRVYRKPASGQRMTAVWTTATARPPPPVVRRRCGRRGHAQPAEMAASRAVQRSRATAPQHGLTCVLAVWRVQAARGAWLCSLASRPGLTRVPDRPSRVRVARRPH